SHHLQIKRLLSTTTLFPYTTLFRSTRAAQPMGYGFRLTIRHTRRSALYSRPCKYLQTEEHRSWLLAGCSRHSSSHVDQRLFHLVSGLLIEQCRVGLDYCDSFEACSI